MVARGYKEVEMEEERLLMGLEGGRNGGRETVNGYRVSF